MAKIPLRISKRSTLGVWGHLVKNASIVWGTSENKQYESVWRTRYVQLQSLKFKTKYHHETRFRDPGFMNKIILYHFLILSLKFSH